MLKGEGHGYWFSIINLTDDTNQTKSLKKSATKMGISARI